MEKRILALVALLFCMFGQVQPKHDASAPAPQPAQPVAPLYSFQNLGDKTIKLIYWRVSAAPGVSFNINPPPFEPLVFAANPEPEMDLIDVIKLYEVDVNGPVPEEHLIGYYHWGDFSDPGTYVFNKINDQWSLTKNGVYIPRVAPYIFKNSSDVFAVAIYFSNAENLLGMFIIPNYGDLVKSGMYENFDKAAAQTFLLTNPLLNVAIGSYPVEAFQEPGEFEFYKEGGEWILTKDGLTIDKLPE